jgi:hypothetical protein
MRINAASAMQLAQQHISIDSVIDKTNLRHVHIAILIKRGKFINIASNLVGSRKSGAGYDTRTIHAERALLKKVGDHRALMGATMIVIRISRVKQVLGESNPCPTCRPHLLKCMKEYGLKAVYYTS